MLARPPWTGHRRIGSEAHEPYAPEVEFGVHKDEFDISPGLEKLMIEWEVCQSPTLSVIQQQALDAEAVVEDSAFGIPNTAPSYKATKANTEKELIPLEKMHFRSKVHRASQVKIKYFSYKFYQHVQDATKVPKLVYCRTAAQAEAVAAALSSRKVLGFDMEWRPFGSYSTALIQLCNQSTIALIHLSKIGVVPRSIIELLESHEIIKVGVAIRGDATRLMRTHGVKMAGLLDLGAAAQRVDSERYPEKGLISLARLSKAYLGKELFKGEHVRMSNWAAPLTHQQRVYAANDAYSGLQIFYVLNQLHGGSADFEVSHVDGTSAGRTATETRINVPKPKEAKSATHDSHQAEIVEEDTVEEDKDSQQGAKQVPSHAIRKILSPKINEAEAVEKARIWANTLVQGHAKVTASSLRSYALWAQGYEIDEIAGLVRDPPLAKTTVENHILMAVSQENLPPTDRLQQLIDGSPYYKRYSYLVHQTNTQPGI